MSRPPELGTILPESFRTRFALARRGPKTPGNASWLCAGGRWAERGEDALQEENEGLLSKDGKEEEEEVASEVEMKERKSTLVMEEEKHQEPLQLRLPVATDCFALVLVAEQQSRPAWLLLVPLVCVAGQCTVLLFMAFTGEYAFAEGVWLTPRSDHASLMAMRLMGLVLSLLKASGEFASALALFQALWLGEPPRGSNRGGGRLRPAAAVACLLQYLMALAVPLICAQVVLAEKSPIYSLLKVLSVWVVVDMDNYIAEYIIEVCDWHHVLWSVPLACAHRGACAPVSTLFSRRTRGWIGRHLAPSQSAVHLPTSRLSRVAFFGLPALLVFLEVGLALALNILPFTYMYRGFVSNVDAPMLLAKSTGLPEGCCPPVLLSSGHGRGWNFSVLLLMPRSAFKEGYEPPAPQVFWVADSVTAHAPSALQVVDGLNGDGVPAVQVGGRVKARRTQAFAWLLRHYSQRETEEIYGALLGRKGVGLYKTHLPYAANFTVPEAPSADLQAYRIFVAATNVKTLALSPETIASRFLHASGCPPGCLHCGSDLGRCFECSEGRYWAPLRGLCAPCAEGCRRCELSARGRCDVGFCKPGFGRTQDGVCASCNISGCLACDRDHPIRAVADPGVQDVLDDALPPVATQADPKTCDACEEGYGLLGGRRCEPCGPHCERCEARVEGNGTGLSAVNCSRCALGYGPVLRPANGTRGPLLECDECPRHCKRCRGAEECLECSKGFAKEGPGGACKACANGCQTCSGAGPGKCDEGGCLPLYGYQKGSCRSCELAHCLECNFTSAGLFQDAKEKCSRCQQGYGRTEIYTCEDCGESCKRCDRAGACEVCIDGYTTDRDPSREGGGRCQVCGDRCLRCDKAGPARCDRCFEGYELDAGTATCLPQLRAAGEEV